MRAYMEKLKARGELLEVTREVDPKHELAAVTDAAHKRWGKPILFHNVRGTKLPVLTNTYGSRARLAEIIGIGPDDFCKQWNNLATIASARGAPRASVAAEWEVAGKPPGAPIPMRPCGHVDLMVPATTEIVIEGRFIPNERRDEGPFGEFMGYYTPVGQNAVFEVVGVTVR